MKINVYSVFDTAAKVFQRPFFAGADGEATRAFADVVNDDKHPVGMHPEDYSLFRVGLFDDGKGTLHPEDPECLCVALELVRRKPVDERQIRLPGLSETEQQFLGAK